jgi:hypothetical protein
MIEEKKMLSLSSLGHQTLNPNCVIFGLHTAVRAFAIGYLAAAAQRMQVLLVGPGMVALDIDTELRELFNSVLGALERLPKIESDKVVLSSLDLSVSTPLLLFSSQVGCWLLFPLMLVGMKAERI